MRILRILVAAGMLAQSVLCAQESWYVQEQSRPLVATVVKVDVLDKRVTVLDTWGKATELYLGTSARVYTARDSTEEFSTIFDLKPGQQVQVSYSGAADNPTSVKIVILAVK